MRVACPEELGPDNGTLDWVKREKGVVVLGSDARKAVQGADCVVTDTWVSMGDTDGARRKKILAPFGVDTALMSQAARGAIFMHCLPAYRGREVAADVIDGPQSVVFDEAENRLHAQKAILAWCLGAR
jgi:ornithine carbamoyltransferase